MIDRLRHDLFESLKKGNSFRVGVLRLLLADIKNHEIEKRGELSGEDIIDILRRQIKKRREAIEMFRRGNRGDLVRKEQEEIKVLEEYLPQEIDPEILSAIIRETILEIEKKEPLSFGRVMRLVMEKVRGKADGKLVSETVKMMLSGDRNS